MDKEIPKALTAVTIEENADPKFYADIGATTHMTNDPSKVYNSYPYMVKKVFLLETIIVRCFT